MAGQTLPLDALAKQFGGVEVPTATSTTRDAATLATQLGGVEVPSSVPPGLVEPGTIDLHTEPRRRFQIADIGGRFALIPALEGADSVEAFHTYRQHYGIFQDAESAARYADTLDQSETSDQRPSSVDHLARSLGGIEVTPGRAGTPTTQLTVGHRYAVTGPFSPLEAEVIGQSAPAQGAEPPTFPLIQPPLNPQALEPQVPTMKRGRFTGLPGTDISSETPEPLTEGLLHIAQGAAGLVDAARTAPPRQTVIAVHPKTGQRYETTMRPPPSDSTVAAGRQVLK